MVLVDSSGHHKPHALLLELTGAAGIARDIDGFSDVSRRRDPFDPFGLAFVRCQTDKSNTLAEARQRRGAENFEEMVIERGDDLVIPSLGTGMGSKDKNSEQVPNSRTTMPNIVEEGARRRKDEKNIKDDKGNQRISKVYL